MWFPLPVTLELEWLSPLLHWNRHYPLDQFQLHCNFSPFPSLYRGPWPTRTVVPLFFIILSSPNPVLRPNLLALLQKQFSKLRGIISPILEWIFFLLFSSLCRLWQQFLLFSTGSKDRDTICRCKPGFFLTLNNVCKSCNRWAFFLCMPVHWAGETADTGTTRGGDFSEGSVHLDISLQHSAFLGQIRGQSPLTPLVFYV